MIDRILYVILTVPKGQIKWHNIKMAWDFSEIAVEKYERREQVRKITKVLKHVYRHTVRSGHYKPLQVVSAIKDALVIY